MVKYKRKQIDWDKSLNQSKPYPDDLKNPYLTKFGKSTYDKIHHQNITRKRARTVAGQSFTFKEIQARHSVTQKPLWKDEKCDL